MKFVSGLPDARHYASVSTYPERYTFIDKGNKLARIISPHPNPFAIKEWGIVVGYSRGKTDGSYYAKKLLFKLIPVDRMVGDVPYAHLARDISKGTFWYTTRAPNWSAVMPLVTSDFPESTVQKWLSYHVCFY